MAQDQINNNNNKTSQLTRLGGGAVAAVEKIITGTGAQVEGYVSPVRETVLKRYPTISALLVTIGATATFLGLEKLFETVSLFQDHPIVLFLLGVAILTFTGRLYKKLS